MSDSAIRSGVEQALLARTWLLIPSFLIGPEVWRGVAEILEMLGQTAIIPSPGRTKPDDSDHLEPWLCDVLDSLPDDLNGPLVVCGYSATTPRLPMVADALIASGFEVTAVLMVNGRIPEDGVSPTERDSPFMDTLDALVRPDDYLPPWHRWWGSMVEDMLPDDEQRQRIFSECKPVPRSVFDQPIPAPELPNSVGLGFLGLGDMYRPSYDHAVGEGWAATRVDGEHLDLVVQPVLVAGAMLSLCRRAESLTPRPVL